MGGSNLAFATSALGRDETLTGRTKTWAELVPVVKSEPLLGFGFGSFWTTSRREFYEMSNAHNGYLDTLLDLGAVGLILYVVWFLICTRRFQRALAVDFGWASLGICFLVMELAYNISESALPSPAGQVMTVLILISFEMSRRAPGSVLTPVQGLRLRSQRRQVGKTALQPPAVARGRSNNRIVRGG